MPEHIFTLAARGISVDAQTNMLTIFGVAEQIGAHSLPAGVPELVIVTFWRRQPGEEGVGFVQRTRFVDPSGKEVGVLETSFRLEKPRHRIHTHAKMVPIRMPGLYHVEIQVRRDDQEQWGKLAASYPIEVVGPDAESAEPLLETSDRTAAQEKPD